jgi:hypothetical protein
MWRFDVGSASAEMIRRSGVFTVGFLVALTSWGSVSAAQGNARTRCDVTSDRFRLDSLPGIGQVSFAGGNVHIRCPARGITLTGDSAEQYQDHDQVIGHAVYDEPRFHVTANFLNYFPNDDRVVATGDVHARLPSGSTLVGPQAEYRRAIAKVRPRAQMSAIARPTVTIVEKDSAGRPQPPTTVVANTVFVDGDSASLIYGGGQVVIHRDSVLATGDSAFIDEPKETMRLMRNPAVKGTRGRTFTLTGDLIDMYSRNRQLYRVLSRANAVAVSDSMTLRSDTIDLRVQNQVLDHAYAWGDKSRARAVSPSQNLLADSLDVTMPGQRIQLVRAVRKAYATGKADTTRFKLVKPDTMDWVLGDTIIAHFDTARPPVRPNAPRDTATNPQIRQLIASGHASSYYHLAPSDTSVKRPAINYVKGRIITVNFDSLHKVATVTTVDSVSGIHLDPLADSASKRTKASAQTNSKAPAQNAARPTTSAATLPKKPPGTQPQRP